MTPLFRRLQPAQKFRISLATIAQFLKIPKHLIVRVESWAYIVFVHRRDKGGQFISYRQLRQWFNAIACQIQHCTTCQQLRQLWLAIESDRKRHHKQYNHQHISWLSNLWTQHGEQGIVENVLTCLGKAITVLLIPVVFFNFWQYSRDRLVGAHRRAPFTNVRPENWLGEVMSILSCKIIRHNCTSEIRTLKLSICQICRR